MYQFYVRYRIPNGTFMDTAVMARNNYEATEQAKAMFGAANVIAVWTNDNPFGAF